MSVLLDTGFLFGFLNKRDERHSEAKALMREIAEGKWGVPYVTDFVADELLTLARVRARGPSVEKAALELLPLPEPALPGLRMLMVDRPVFAAAIGHFSKQRTRGLSFTDATNVAMMEAVGIRHLATFDEDFRGIVSTLPRAGR